jgi:hypothetical protein
MQPCAVCGGQAVDAAGYCTQCGNFRGVPPETYPAGVISIPPAYLSQTSGPPAYTYPAAPPKPRRNPFVIPLIALSVTLIVLVAAIVVVALTRSDRSSNQGGPPSPSASSLVDPCVVGNWRVTRHTEQVPLPLVGDVQFTSSGTGARVRLAADGTGVTEFGEGTAFVAIVAGAEYKLIFKGSVNYDYRTANGRVVFSNLGPDGTATLTVDGEEQASQALTGTADEANYTCDGSTLREFTTKYQTELRRES